MDADKEKEVNDVLHTVEGTRVLTALVTLFAGVKDETFAIFDEQYDSAAESDAAKQGWSTLAAGVGMIALLNRLEEVGVRHGE